MVFSTFCKKFDPLDMIWDVLWAKIGPIFDKNLTFWNVEVSYLKNWSIDYEILIYSDKAWYSLPSVKIWTLLFR